MLQQNECLIETKIGEKMKDSARKWDGQDTLNVCHGLRMECFLPLSNKCLIKFPWLTFLSMEGK